MKTPIITAAVLKLNTQSTTEDRVKVLDPLNSEIQKALDAVNGKATSFTVCSASHVREIAWNVEAMLDRRGVTKANRGGTVVTFRPAGPSASSYKHSAVSTQITMERASTGAWYLTSITRVDVYPNQTERLSIQITAAARDDVTRHAMRDFVVAPSAGEHAAA